MAFILAAVSLFPDLVGIIFGFRFVTGLILAAAALLALVENGVIAVPFTLLPATLFVFAHLIFLNVCKDMIKKMIPCWLILRSGKY